MLRECERLNGAEHAAQPPSRAKLAGLRRAAIVGASTVAMGEPVARPPRDSSREPLRAAPRRYWYDHALTEVGKHFELTIREDGFSYQRKQDQIIVEAELDGIYVIRTSVKAEKLTSENTVRAYKDLSTGGTRLSKHQDSGSEGPPIFHWLDDRIRAHVFLCMLAYYVEWHMREKLAPLLFEDHERDEAEATRTSIVHPAPRSAAARAKDKSEQTVDELPVHSFRTLLADLGTLAKNRVRLDEENGSEFYELTQTTTVQRRALELLNVAL